MNDFENLSLSDLELTDTLEEFSERMDKEILGAWRAGYDYLHVYEEIPELARTDVDSLDSISFSQYVHPSNYPPHRHLDGLCYGYTFVLDDQEIERAKEMTHNE